MAKPEAVPAEAAPPASMRALRRTEAYKRQVQERVARDAETRKAENVERLKTPKG